MREGTPMSPHQHVIGLVPSPTCHWAASDALRTSLSVKMPGSGALTPKLMERHMTWLYYEIDILRPPRDFGRLPLPK